MLFPLLSAPLRLLAVCALLQSLVPMVALLAMGATVSVLPHKYDSQLQAQARLICDGDVHNWMPTILTPLSLSFSDGTVSQGQSWIGECRTFHQGQNYPYPFLVITSSNTGKDEAFRSFPANSDYTIGSGVWTMAPAGAPNSPALLPLSYYTRDYGKLMLSASGSTTWISYHNSSATYVCPNDILLMNGYSAATDTFFARTETCGIPTYSWKSQFVMRKNGVDQIIENYCPPSATCTVGVCVFNDGTTDHLYRATYSQDSGGALTPMLIYRQSLVNGGPQTTNSVLAVGPPTPTTQFYSFLCWGTGADGPTLVMHSMGKILFGACSYGGLFYVDLRDPNPTTPTNVQLISTCPSAEDGSISMTHDRLYVLCDRTTDHRFSYDLRVYPLVVAADGAVTINETNYFNFNQPDCIISSFRVFRNPVAGRPDAVWLKCNYDYLTNICGFGSWSSVTSDGQTFNCTKCPVNSLQTSSTGSFFADTTCTPCPSGTYVADPSNATCTSCLTGTYLASPSSTNCTICPAGTYQNLTGTTSCVTCPVPYIISSEGSTTVANCTQEICEIPGSNPKYCKFITSADAIALAQPSTCAIFVVTLLTIVAALF